MRTGARRRIGAFSAFAALTVLALALVGLDPTALCALPALILPALLALRRYPGERTLALRLGKAHRERRQASSAITPLASSLQLAVPRGGLLLASSLAVRPPPTARLAAG
jgi:hypothetical protein